MTNNEKEIELFIHNFENKFDAHFPGGMKMASKFRTHPEWSSLQAVIVVVGFEEDYGVTINADELRDAQTLEDLYRLVMQKL